MRATLGFGFGFLSLPIRVLGLVPPSFGKAFSNALGSRGLGFKTRASASLFLSLGKQFNAPYGIGYGLGR